MTNAQSDYLIYSFYMHFNQKNTFLLQSIFSWQICPIILLYIMFWLMIYILNDHYFYYNYLFLYVFFRRRNILFLNELKWLFLVSIGVKIHENEQLYQWNVTIGKIIIIRYSLTKILWHCFTKLILMKITIYWTVTECCFFSSGKFRWFTKW